MGRGRPVGRGAGDDVVRSAILSAGARGASGRRRSSPWAADPPTGPGGPDTLGAMSGHHDAAPAGRPGTGEARPEARPDWEARLLTGGSEPDPRFSLANERTFLAWIRTSLALLAGGVAVEAFTGTVFSPAMRTLLGCILLVLSALLALGAGVRWLRLERAMRHARPLPLPVLAPLLAAVVLVGSVALAVAVLTRAG